MSNWERKILSEVANLVHDKINTVDLGLHNYISTNNMLPDKGGVKCADKLPESKKVNSFTIGDVLFSNIRTYFKKIWRANISGGSSPDVLIFREKNRNTTDGGFLYYVISSDAFINHSVATAKGAKMPRGDKEALLNYELQLPSISEQQSIVEILSSLDEKIELNRKQNRAIEAIAQALFKRWFTEFEFPDENGQPYKSSGGAMQPSELGVIPEGWRVGKLDEIIGELETGSRPQGGVGQFTEGVPSIGAESITRIGEFDYSKTKYVPEEYFARMRRGFIKDRDVLIYKDGGQPGRFDVRISMFGGGFPYETACINEHVFRLQAKNPVYQNYLYLWFTSYLILEELRFRGAKAAIPGINTTDVKELDFLFMDEGVLEKFDEVIEPLFLKLLHNSREIAVLSKLRDTLLPKLMSGELRVA